MFAVSGARIGWLFGAGASASGGIPTAGQLLDKFKAVLYASQNNLATTEVRMGDPLVGERVRRYFDNAHGLPPLGDPDEYATAFEAAYPDPAVRREWLARWTANGRPSYGHRVVAALMASGLIRWIATTNFDGLVEQAYEQLRTREQDIHAMTVAAIDSADRATRALREDDWPLLIKLHGDITSERLKNTSSELREQDETLRQSLLDASRKYGLAVIGYSGRDTSVMQTLRAALAQKNAFPGGLFWLTSSAADVFPAVGELLDQARAAGADAQLVESATFDETFGVIERHAILPTSFADHAREGRPRPHVRGVVLDETEGGRFPALRFNALPVTEVPQRSIHVRCRHQIDQRPHELIKPLGVPGFGVASGRDFYGYGLTNIWERALNRYEPEVSDEVIIAPDGSAPDPVAVGLLNEAVARALAWDRPFRPRFRRRGHFLVVWPDGSDESAQQLEPLSHAYGAALTGTFEGERTWREGVRIRLDWRLDRVWLLFTPWTFVDRSPRDHGKEGPRSRFAEPDPADAWVRERWVERRNKFWAAALGAWADVLVGEGESSVAAPEIDNARLVAARFTIGKQTAFSLPGARGTGGLA